MSSFVIRTSHQQFYVSKNGGKDQESIQSSTTPDLGYHMGKWQKHNLTSQTRAKRSALSQQVTTRQQWTDTKAWQTQNINNTIEPRKKYRLGTVSKNILLEGLNRFHGANSTVNSLLICQVFIIAYRNMASMDVGKTSYITSNAIPCNTYEPPPVLYILLIWSKVWSVNNWLKFCLLFFYFKRICHESFMYIKWLYLL